MIVDNIIWMMCWNHVSDPVVKHAVFGNSLGSKIMFHYLNIKACVVGQLFGKIKQFGRGTYHWKWSYFLKKRKVTAYPLTAIKLILSGNLKELIYRFRKIMKRNFSANIDSDQAFITRSEALQKSNFKH